MLSPFLTVSMFPLYPNCIPMFSQYPYYVPTGSPLFSPDVPIIFPLRNSLCSSAIPRHLHENPSDVRTIHISIFPLHPCHFPIFPQHALNVRIWGFPEIGVPPVIISFQWDFPLQKKTSYWGTLSWESASYWGTPILGNHHITSRSCTAVISWFQNPMSC